MNYDKTNSLTYLIAETLYKSGPMKYEELIAKFSDYSERGVRATIGRMCFEADLEKFAGMLQVRTHVRRHFAEKYADKSEVAGERVAAAFKPLTKLPWAQNMHRLRDISFITASVGPEPVWGI